LSLNNFIFFLQEIVLNEISGIETIRCSDKAEGAKNPPVFEMRTAAGTVYMVGEDPTWGGQKDEVVN
jgi:hypothetical protein